jgi:hypothetical protein
MGLILSIENTIQAYNSNNLLLDRFAEGMAAAYYSGKLLTNYTGNAIRVRRSSDNAEADIGFDGTDLDTSSLTSFCSGTDGFVTTWVRPIWELATTLLKARRRSQPKDCE